MSGLPPNHSDAVVQALAAGPKSNRELQAAGALGNLPPFECIAALRALEADGVVVIDPDQFPDEYVPGNPLVVRLPGDDQPWPGWARWNL